MDGWIDQLNSFAHGTVSHDVVVVLGCKIQSPEQLCVVDILPVGISKRGSNFCWSLRCYLRWTLFGSILAGCQIPGSEGLSTGGDWRPVGHVLRDPGPHLNEC